MIPALKEESVFYNGVWSIAWVKSPKGRERLKVYQVKGMHSDWPVEHTNGKVGYDFPETIPDYIKAEVKKAFYRRRHATG